MNTFVTAILLFLFFLVFDFCRFCVVIQFIHPPPQRPMTSNFEGFSIPDFMHYIYFLILILEKEPVFPFSMLSAKQGHYSPILITSLVWRGPWLNPGPPALKANTLPLGYRGDGEYYSEKTVKGKTYFLEFIVIKSHWCWFCMQTQFMVIFVFLMFIVIIIFLHKSLSMVLFKEWFYTFLRASIS